MIMTAPTVLEKEHHISRGQRRLDSTPGAMLPAANASMVAKPFSAIGMTFMMPWTSNIPPAVRRTTSHEMSRA